MYDTDFIQCILWDAIAENCCEYCKKGDVIGVKGRIQTSSYEKDGEKVFRMDIIAENGYACYVCRAWSCDFSDSSC